MTITNFEPLSAPRQVRKRKRRDKSSARPGDGATYEMRPLSSLKPYARNAKVHSPKQVGQIGQSIKAFGLTSPIIVDQDNIIIAGHGRFEAAKQLGLRSVPVLQVDHLSPAQVQAYRIADNKLAEGASWDEGLLRIELEELLALEDAGTLDFDLGTLGFETAEVDILLDTRESSSTERQDPLDEAIAEPDAPLVRRGELWQLGRHRLLCGSALDASAYAVVMEGVRARMVLTDPPYNVKIQGHVSSKGHDEFAMASGEMSTQAFTTFLSTMLGHAVRSSLPGGLIYAFMDWRHLEELSAAARAQSLEKINLAVWAKTNAGMGSLYRSQHELCGIYRAPGARHINNIELGKFGRSRSNLWTYRGVNSFGRGRDADLADHPTVKPVAMLQDAIRDVTHRRDIVLDPFGGSGSTLLAAERCGRTARLIEIAPRYVEVTIRRWEAMTGETAIETATRQTLAHRASGEV